VEHVAVVAETQEVARGGVALEGEQVLEVALAGRGVLPLLQGALGEVAVPVDSGGPAGDDVHSSVAVVGDGRYQRPVLVVRAEELDARVVTDGVGNAVSDPGTEGIAVVETGDRRRDQTLGREHLGIGNADLTEPSLVEDDLLVGIAESDVVLRQVGEGVGDVSESVTVGRGGEPVGEVVTLGAGNAPRVVSRSGRPEVAARA